MSQLAPPKSLNHPVIKSCELDTGAASTPPGFEKTYNISASFGSGDDTNISDKSGNTGDYKDIKVYTKEGASNRVVVFLHGTGNKNRSSALFAKFFEDSGNVEVGMNVV
jgi:hypothetical protein